MRHFLAVLAILGCSQQNPGTANSTDKTTLHPQSSALHSELFSAAKANDESRFQAALTTESVEIINEYFNRMELLQRPIGAAPYGWKDFLVLHAELAHKRPSATPYPVRQTDKGPRLDIANHPDSAFLKKAMVLPSTAIQHSNGP